jgi:hypothetical protein
MASQQNSRAKARDTSPGRWRNRRQMTEINEALERRKYFFSVD